VTLGITTYKADCCYGECRYDECRYDECHGTSVPADLHQDAFPGYGEACPPTSRRECRSSSCPSSRQPIAKVIKRFYSSLMLPANKLDNLCPASLFSPVYYL
jgi:hypothetical protein